jgi:4-hydroxybenzoate polyprenyltransferase
MKRLALRTALRLGRVSNLPTVWTNVLAGMALAGGALMPARAAPLAFAVSLLYVAGMYLNDAFDHRWDARHRPDRPIPAGEVDLSTVVAAGIGLMLAGVIVLAIAPGQALSAGLALCACIILYDATHKKNPAAPVVMGLCRVLVYAIGARAVTPSPRMGFYVGAAALLAYLVGLTMVARHESRNPRLPALVGALIAGICLLDALMLLVTGHAGAAALAVAGFFLTRRLQRHVPGT